MFSLLPLSVLTQSASTARQIEAIALKRLFRATLTTDNGGRLDIEAPKRVRVALGLHPEVVAQRHAEVALFCALLPEARYVGEIGLDGSPTHRDSMTIQQAVFDRILDACSGHGGRIMTIHSRGAATLVLDALERHHRAGVPILHWFSGTARELERAIDLGCWFSVGPAMLRSRSGRDLASRIQRQSHRYVRLHCRFDHNK